MPRSTWPWQWLQTAGAQGQRQLAGSGACGFFREEPQRTGLGGLSQGPARAPRRDLCPAQEADLGPALPNQDHAAAELHAHCLGGLSGGISPRVPLTRGQQAACLLGGAGTCFSCTSGAREPERRQDPCRHAGARFALCRPDGGDPDCSATLHFSLPPAWIRAALPPRPAAGPQWALPLPSAAFPGSALVL